MVLGVVITSWTTSSRSVNWSISGKQKEKDTKLKQILCYQPMFEFWYCNINIILYIWSPFINKNLGTNPTKHTS